MAYGFVLRPCEEAQREAETLPKRRAKIGKSIGRMILNAATNKRELCKKVALLRDIYFALYEELPVRKVTTLHDHVASQLEYAEEAVKLIRAEEAGGHVRVPENAAAGPADPGPAPPVGNAEEHWLSHILGGMHRSNWATNDLMDALNVRIRSLEEDELRD